MNDASKREAGTMGIGIAGLGTVGAATVGLLAEHATALSNKSGCALTVTGVCARDRTRDRGVDLGGVDWYDDAVALAQAPATDIFVELIGGPDGVAKAAVEAALGAGKLVVTANKALVARHGAALATLAEDTPGAALFYEAGVAGGIPAIKALREGMVANRITRVSGILNGTCNYILTEMEMHGSAFGDVLAEAQRLGYAEADPTADVGGFDAAHKLAILAAIAFSRAVDFDGVAVDGIEQVSAEDIAAAREMGYKIRLLGIAERAGEGITQRVCPCLVPASEPLSTIDDVVNAVFIEGEPIGGVMLTGPGAGGGATASAVVADIVDAARGNCPPVFGVPHGALSAAADGTAPAETPGAFYMRLLLEDRPGALAEVAAALGEEGVSILRMRQYEHDDDRAPVIIVTHRTDGATLAKARARIETLEVSMAAPVTMRIVES